ncbi:MAG: nucleotide-binding universal stress UspA family protein [Glaciecola sp.]|jgi:nucleotide-binding universal stress UspA family protein
MTRYAKTRISNPSRYFETPVHVLSDYKLSRDEKVRVLKSMAVDADQMGEATSEGMAGTSPAYNAKDLQSALIQLERAQETEAVDDSIRQNARFRRIMVVTTVNEDLNREIADVAFDMAEIVGGKVCLLNVIPPAIEGAGMAAAGPMGIAPFPAAIDNTQVVKDRTEQLAELVFESDTNVETEIEVRTGQIEQVIINYADDCEADLILVGSPHRSWLEALFDPSIVRRVTRSAPCPVLVVPEPA